MSRPRIEVAKKRVKVPDRHWGSKPEVVNWASGLLAGAPPKLVARVPAGFDGAGQPANWGHIQKGWFANRLIDIESDPPGLLVTIETGTKFVPRVNPKPVVPGSNPQEVVESIDAERQLRDFVQSENSLVNQTAMDAIEDQVSSDGFRLATRAFYEHGKRIMEFVASHTGFTKDRVWKELEKWGRGNAGYSRHHHEYATHMYEWLGPILEDHPVFRFTTTRVQHIIMGTTKSDDGPAERNRLLVAMVDGPLSGLTDDQVSWALAKRKKSLPISESERQLVTRVGAQIRRGERTEERDVREFLAVLHAGATRKGRGTPASPQVEGTGVAR